MNILLTRFPLESSYGGAEVQTLSLMKGLEKKGHEVTFLGSCSVLLEKTRESGIRNYELRIGSPPVTKWGAISFLWRKREMRRRLIEAFNVFFERGRACRDRVEKPLHSPAPLGAGSVEENTAIFMLSLSEKLLLTDWAVNQGMRVFWIEHDRIGPWLTYNPWLPRLRKLSHKVTTIVVSDLSRNLYLKLGWDSKKVLSIPNGIDVERFRSCLDTSSRVIPSDPASARDCIEGATRLATRHDTHRFHVGCIARLTRDKGVDLLIEAVVTIPNVHLTIVGEGREKDRLQAMIEQLKLNKRVAIQPASHTILTFYHSLDALVLPSRSHDPFGLVIAEAMAAGIPTIVSDACGIAAHLNPDDALIVPAGTARALQNAIGTLMRFPKLRRTLEERGPKIARERFSDTKMLDAYAALLENPPNALYSA